jgi:hypothetical protein
MLPKELISSSAPEEAAKASADLIPSKQSPPLGLLLLLFGPKPGEELEPSGWEGYLIALKGAGESEQHAGCKCACRWKALAEHQPNETSSPC